MLHDNRESSFHWMKYLVVVIVTFLLTCKQENTEITAASECKNAIYMIGTLRLYIISHSSRCT